MNKYISILLVFFSCSLFAKDMTQTDNIVYGVSGKEKANVEQRLKELHQLKTLNAYKQEEILEQIEKSLQPYGFFQAKSQIEFLGNNRIKVFITPGPQIHLSSVKISIDGEGSKEYPLRSLIQKTSLHQGMPLSIELYDQFKNNLITSAENLGYLHAHFKKAEIIVDIASNSAEIVLNFYTGPHYFFGQIEFNPTTISPQLLHRYVPFKPGQAYSTEDILKLNNSLSNSGYFSSVVVKPEISDDTSVPVRVHVEPVPKYSYSLGLGYGTDTGVRGKASVQIIPLNERGHKFNATAQGSFTQSVLQAQYSIPGKNPDTDQYNLTGNFSNLNYNTGYSNALLLSLSQLHNLEHTQRALSLNGLYESFNYSLEPRETKMLLYPKANFSFIDTKNKLFSPSGYNISFNALGANKLTFSNFNFGQLSMDARAALYIDPLRLRLYGHTIQGITETHDINQVPLSLALLLGGADNLKALPFNSIGPGKIISYGGFEVQKETFKNWYLIGFYDAGDVYNPDPKNFQYDVGGGLMWVSPIGPIKVGLAQAVNNQLERASSNPRLVISMGPDL